MKSWLTALAAMTTLVAATPAGATDDLLIVRYPASAPTLGTTIRGSSASTFSISTSGVVTRTSGNAIRLTSASVTPPTIYIYCGDSAPCRNKDVRVRIQPAGSSGPATISRLRVGGLYGGAYANGSAPADAASLTFDLDPIGRNSYVSFRLGMDVLLAANAASGPHTFDYAISASFR